MAKKKHSHQKSKKPQSKKPLFSKHTRWVVGVHACREVLNVRPQSIVKAFVKRGSEGEELSKNLNHLDLDVRWVNDQELAKIARTHQGIALEVNDSPELDWSSLYKKEKAIVLILDGVVDPHNLGAIMRTAWLMGCEAVITSQHRSVGLTPSVAKVASGAAEHLPLVIEPQLPSIMKELQDNGFWVLGLAHSEKNTLWKQELDGKVAWVIGSEEKGLRKPVANACDQLVSIPQVIPTASYNASVAAAIALTETVRQHQQ